MSREAAPQRSQARPEVESIPTMAYFELLYRCNLRCNYCYVGDQKNHVETYVPSMESIAKIFGELRRRGVTELVLLGGEPTMHPDFPAVLELARELSFADLGVVTNATRLTPVNLKAIESFGAFVDVSVRAGTKDTWAALTGSRPTWDRMWRGIGQLSDLGVPLALEYDCLPGNHHELPTLADELIRREIRISQIQLHRVMPRGNADGLQRTTLTPQQWNLLLDDAATVEGRLGCPVVLEDLVPLCLLDSRHWSRVVGCACGHGQATVDPWGNIRYCPCDPVGAQPLPEATSVTGRRDIVVPAPACDSCVLYETCGGGCPASRANLLGTAKDGYFDDLRAIRHVEVMPKRRQLAAQGIHDL